MVKIWSDVAVAENNEKYKHIRAAAHLTQFGLNIVTPIILCIMFALWLKNKFNMGGWVVIVAIILGVAAAVLNMITFIKTVNREIGGKNNDEKREN